jgi:flagellar biosynthesis/type III secretory pathway M-ring protein FliF/YscJ
VGGENLDAGLEPIAQVLILLIVLIAVASVAFFIVNKIAIRRKERAHNKLSTSRRSKHTWVDLSAGREKSQAEASTQRSSRRTRSRSSSDHVMLDILAKPKDSKGNDPPPDESSSA